MVNVKPNKDENGNYVNNGYFGWGIAYEIGHCLDQGTISMPEITNNYFAELAKGGETNADRRFNYTNIYNKVSSGQKGASPDVFTQLGLYWQLHLAYDKGTNHTTYSNYQEQLNNLFYAKLCYYSREPGRVPKPNGIALMLGDKDQTLMCLACAVTEKNVLEFFERWGKEPNKDTIAYAEQFEKETRAIFYANDDSRTYVREHAEEGSKLNTDATTEAISAVEAKINPDKRNEVNLTITPNGTVPADDILGYEIVRCTITVGKTQEATIGFTQTNQFTDTITSLNNHTVSYKVIMVDQYLNRSAVAVSDMLKVEHKGVTNKSKFHISTTDMQAEVLEKEINTIKAENEEEHARECQHGKVTIDPATFAIDNDINTSYAPQLTGTVDEDNTKSQGEIILDFNEKLAIQGLQYTDITSKSAVQYKIYVQDGVDETGNYTFSENPVATGTFKNSKDSEIIYFAYKDQKYICAYPTKALKIELIADKNAAISIAELDVLAPTGDNVEIRITENKEATLIGTLHEDYKYGDEATNVIPAGSLIFTGKYKGNPAYNIILVFDEEGEQVMGVDKENNLVADQIILANVPENGNITDVADGTWIYWIKPEYLDNMKLPKKVRAELYRVDDAKTNEGQRLVSDSLFEELTATDLDKLPEITFTK